MRSTFSIAAGSALIWFASMTVPSLAQGKTVKACVEEWRADKAGFQARGVTEKAYVEQCRSGASSPPVAQAPTAPLPQPSAPAQQPSGGSKTAKACVEEWRADKAGFQARGITEKAYVAQCRAGTVTTIAAPAPAPVAPPPPPASPANAGGKTAKTCIEEWRADKANFQARGITEKAYVAECRTGTATTVSPITPSTTTTTAAPPSNNPPAAVPSRPTSTTTAPAQAPYGTTTRAPSTGTPTAAGQFSTEAQAKAVCPGDTVVWVNLRSKIYHFAGTHNYGNTMDGAYMCEKDTAAQGMRAAKNEQHP